MTQFTSPFEGADIKAGLRDGLGGETAEPEDGSRGADSQR